MKKIQNKNESYDQTLMGDTLEGFAKPTKIYSPLGDFSDCGGGVRVSGEFGNSVMVYSYAERLQNILDRYPKTPPDLKGYIISSNRVPDYILERYEKQIEKQDMGYAVSMAVLRVPAQSEVDKANAEKAAADAAAKKAAAEKAAADALLAEAKREFAEAKAKREAALAKLEFEKQEKMRLEAIRLEEERIAIEKAELERLEIEKFEHEKEAARQLELEKLELEKRELEAKKVEEEKAAALRRKELEKLKYLHPLLVYELNAKKKKEALRAAKIAKGL